MKDKDFKELFSRDGINITRREVKALKKSFVPKASEDA